MDGDVPQRVWTGKHVSYRHVKVFGCLAYVHVAKEKRGKLDSKTRPCIFLGHGDDEFGYRLWNLAEKKVIQNHNIVFMEEMTIANWESKKRTRSSESTDRDRLKETRVYPDRSLTPIGEQYEMAGFGQETGATGRGQNAETGQDPESDSDEEPVAETQGRRYPLRERRACAANRPGGARKL